MRDLLLFGLANQMLAEREGLVMSDALSRQLEAYYRLRPQLIAESKSGWALVVHEELVRVFDEYDEAALYADEHFANEQVLIRHTAEHRGIAPFIVARR